MPLTNAPAKKKKNSEGEPIYAPLTEAEIAKLLQIVTAFTGVDARTHLQQVRFRKTLLKVLTHSGRYVQKVGTPPLAAGGSAQPNLVESVFNYLGTNIVDAATKKNASRAFEQLCVWNQEVVLNQLSQFLALFGNMKDNQQIVSGLATAICSREQYLKQYLEELCRPYCSELARLLTVIQQEKSAAVAAGGGTQPEEEEGEAAQHHRKRSSETASAMCKQLDMLTLIIQRVPRTPEDESANQ
jgi:hypothetical protein